MGISIKEIVAGRKTFFITPDTSLIPEVFLEDYFALGYECYFIEYDKRISLKKKIDILISIFHDVIIFFNIDYNVPDVEWPVFIKRLTEEYKNQACIGVVYTKRQTKDEKTKLEYKYLYEIGLACGCVQLEYQKKQNFGLIEKILYANQAQGRRKNIRALCTKAESGKSERKREEISSLKTSEVVSTVIGMRGSFTIKIERRPTTVRIRVEEIITIAVHLIVLKKSFDERSLLMETTVVQKTRGTTIYLPMRINNSVIKEIKAAKAALFIGRTIPATSPSTIPIKYFNQTFIF